MKQWVKVLIVIVLVFVYYGILTHLGRTRQRIDSYVDTCFQLGYQTHIVERRTLYCVTYGLEPQIELVGSIDDVQ